MDEEKEETRSEAIKYKIFYDLLRISMSFSVCFLKGCGIISSDKRLHLKIGLILYSKHLQQKVDNWNKKILSLSLKYLCHSDCPRC